LIVLGEHENRPIGWAANGNFGVKLREFVNFIRRNDLNIDDIVLFTDAYDVAYFGNQQILLERFREFETPIVFGCEKYCFPDPHLQNEYHFREFEFSFLNSGMFIGRVWALRLCTEDYQYDDMDDDQRFWTNQFLQKPEFIELDYNNRMFLNMHDMDMSSFSVSDNNVVSYKGRNPLFIHDNGPVKTLIDQFLR
jgi:hypothetical protein